MDEKTIAINVLGHVDHGKSTVLGHLLYKMGYVSEHELEQLKKDAEKHGRKFKWSDILDVYEEERAKGKTSDVSYFPFTIPTKEEIEQLKKIRKK